LLFGIDYFVAANFEEAARRASVTGLKIAIVTFFIEIKTFISASFEIASMITTIAIYFVAVVAFLVFLNNEIAAYWKLAKNVASVGIVFVAVIALLFEIYSTITAYAVRNAWPKDVIKRHIIIGGYGRWAPWDGARGQKSGSDSCPSQACSSRAFKWFLARHGARPVCFSLSSCGGLGGCGLGRCWLRWCLGNGFKTRRCWSI
jgi:hypothetical protein